MSMKWFGNRYKDGFDDMPPNEYEGGNTYYMRGNNYE